MLAKTRNKLQMLWGQLSIPVKAGFSNFLSPFELTKSSWAIQIKSLAEVPDFYKSFFEPFLTNESVFPFTVLTPSYENFIHKTTEKLIINFDNEIYILERSNDAFETQCYPVDGISYVEMKTALLASSFTICGMTNEGGYASSTLKFNSVTNCLFTPILKRVRSVSLVSKNVTQDQDEEKFNCLADVNFKFMNFARHSLLDGEKVIQFILQPDIQEELLTFLKKTYYRTISPTHISILTDWELIVIKEDADRKKEDRYGAIWNYFPLGKIMSLSVSEKPGNLVGLLIRLSGDVNFELDFQSSMKEELDQLITRFEELSAK